MGSSHSVHTYIHTETIFSCPGGNISGVVNINSKSSTPAGQLFIKLTGTEKTRWRSSSGKRRKTHSQKLTLTELLYPIWHFDGTLNKGQFTIPFSLQLPANLVPSFNLEDHEGSGHISYTLEAVVPDSTVIQAYQTIIWINSPIENSIAVPPAQDYKRLEVSNCCCFKIAITHLTAEVYRPAAVIDEDINLSVRVDNSLSKYRVERVACFLIKNVRLKAESLFRVSSKVISYPVVHTIVDVNIPPGASEESERFISIPVTLKTQADDMWHAPSVVSGLIECEYKVKVELSFDNFCGVGGYHLYIPVKIYNGRFVANTRFTHPPEISTDWNPIELASAPIHVDSFIDSSVKLEDSAHIPTHEETISNIGHEYQPPNYH